MGRRSCAGLAATPTKTRLYRAFRELGRVIRTITLLRFADAQLRDQIPAITNEAEAFHGFSAWLFFGRETIAPRPDRSVQVSGSETGGRYSAVVDDELRLPWPPPANVGAIEAARAGSSDGPGRSTYCPCWRAAKTMMLSR
ncbi:transposase [Amycolatopsis alba]|uniref:transposase n=1 Tax=Amycolatopsis alba TaxID=76020 RepID=UPI001FD7708F|nr:transposase [Amycolatopsis alba]